ncbi:superfamily II DNA/RNA helicase, SNF2 family protein [Clostridium pasteurianum DSM 525 = ATCC 6013]|uniref:SNF2 helicase associated domain protein n=1 Tax=Clostridium pasteurianum DSM 525 = ATCC 6013 TaxID=1262449 RepID=A0A0H3J6X7_CLOPA|nr:SNF2 helicase associated domain-containing protein [Clostridium pasteurianum]AJA49224.1 superfamily II DNA/RNA helicase, SNF2 family protein [Clostridium pasteurianum DSM 525 = ATCC 6013]AJA53212.1 superfamily II DNA/RNA helicase, SNF2 family protein [Clostridium pasteurianum DSM 525 = ATCC 6013]AOZ76406.1 helicase [Clostridium pasteurianum DSM 525 = ATCC 6013]AOZ80203.1 helicase [Clostridium pasteurianum]ELP59157.1 Superfamily II DNA/RNA helicase, SNF2 family protein [Clostridium pasteuria
MDKNLLMQIFNEQITGKNHSKGLRIVDNDLVSSIEFDSEGEIVYIKGKVISENLFSEYKTSIEMDAVNNIIVSTYCSCKDYENNEHRQNYCCKHLMATFYKSINKLIEQPLLNSSKTEALFEHNKNIVDTDTLDILLGKDRDKCEVKIEVYINRNQWDHSISAEFKIGTSSMSSNNLYVLKDINQFLMAIYNGIPVTYGKNFTLNMHENKLGMKNRKLVDFIQTLLSIDGSSNYFRRVKKSNIEGKYIHIPDYLLRNFFHTIKNHRVYLNTGFLYRSFETEILETPPPIEFDLRIVKGEYVLKLLGDAPLVLGNKENIFLYGTSIYMPNYEYCIKINPYINVFKTSKIVKLPISREEIILRDLIPNLDFLAEDITLSKSIRDKIVKEKCEPKFYFDKDGKDIIVTLKVKYGAFEFNIFEDCTEKIIYRDSKKESQALGMLRGLGFEEINNKFYILWGDDYIFRFFKSEVNRLQTLGEVFYSENFKGIKSINSKNISAHIKTGKYNYFEMDFNLGDIPAGETAIILRAFRDNLKYYKLKSGEYLDLEELEIRKFLKLLDSVSPINIKKNHIEIPKNKGLYIDEYMEKNKIRYIKGKAELKKIRNKFGKIDSLSFKEPENLQGSLREYQKIGYNWFRTLDYLGFGGILGDEMGLGKTFQSITFLLSNPGKKSLIVVPTSLVYNWAHEFERFAPTMNIAVANGSKKEREGIIKNIDKYDVIITTYNLLKRDFQLYRSIEFDYCLLDEAQNIKNSHSQNALTVKKVKAKSRFALSGTPMENSVMELWSVFDFIMPGYLYDEKRFSVRYYKKIKEEPEVIEDLNRLIKPFILRRRKKDVIKELPDKIEKTMMINLEDKQKKVYGTYAKHAVELIKKKVQDEEFKNSKIEILAYITKLRQICLDPSVVMEDYNGSSAKIEALSDLLTQSIEEGHRILVFSQFTSVLKNIAKRIELEKIDYSYLDGSVSSKNRMSLVESFNRGKNSVFLISLKAGGTGLNLTSADVVIHFDPWWNPAVEQQATDRAHRIGQKNVVEVIKLVAKGTIEEKIIELQEEKKKLIDSLLGDEVFSGDGIADLTEDEIVNLFK